MTHPESLSMSFSAHPLIRLALGDQALRHRLRCVQLDLRRLTDALRKGELTPPEQDQAVESLRSELPQLGLSVEDTVLFERDLLRLMMKLMPRPALLRDLFVLELAHCQVVVEPSFWWKGWPALGHAALPKLRNASNPESATTNLRLPAICSDAAAAAARLAAEAVEAGTIGDWSIRDCETVLRLLVMHSLLSAFDAGSDDGKQVSFRAFAGEGMHLWEALALRVNWQADPEATPFLWELDLRASILQVLRERCETPKPVEAGSGPELPDPPHEHDEGAAAEVAAGLLRETAEATPGQAAVAIRVITTRIPPATHKDDKDAIEQYEPLRKPVPVASMPPAPYLQALLEEQEAEFPWAEAPLRLLRERLVTPSLLGVRELRLPPVLLVGPPGCGKSRFVRRLAQRLQVPYMPLSLAGAHDAKLLSGTSRGWATGDASPLIRLLLQHRTASAFVLLDELDKVGRNGESASAIANQLLGLLEPETARRWRDGFLLANCDLSRVMYWGTANSLAGIGSPLLSRMELVMMRGPDREHLPGIAAGIVADLEQEWQLPAGTLPPPPESVWSVGTDNLRTMRRALMEYLHYWVQQECLPQRLH